MKQQLKMIGQEKNIAKNQGNGCGTQMRFLRKPGFSKEENMRYTEYHAGVAVIKDKTLLKEAMAKLAKLEDAEEQGRLNVYPEGFPLSPILEEKYTKGKKE